MPYCDALCAPATQRGDQGDVVDLSTMWSDEYDVHAGCNDRHVAATTEILLSARKKDQLVEDIAVEKTIELPMERMAPIALMVSANAAATGKDAQAPAKESARGRLQRERNAFQAAEERRRLAEIEHKASLVFAAKERRQLAKTEHNESLDNQQTKSVSEQCAFEDEARVKVDKFLKVHGFPVGGFGAKKKQK